MDEKKIIEELYTLLLKASGCVEALDALSGDLNLSRMLPGLPHVQAEITACLAKHGDLYRQIQMQPFMNPKP